MIVSETVSSYGKCIFDYGQNADITIIFAFCQFDDLCLLLGVDTNLPPVSYSRHTDWS